MDISIWYLFDKFNVVRQLKIFIPRAKDFANASERVIELGEPFKRGIGVGIVVGVARKHRIQKGSSVGLQVCLNLRHKKR